MTATTATGTPTRLQRPNSTCGERHDVDGLEASAKRLEASGLYRVLRRIHRDPAGQDSAELPLVLVAHPRWDIQRPSVKDVTMMLATFDDDGLRDVVATLEGSSHGTVDPETSSMECRPPSHSLTTAVLRSWIGRIAFAVAQDASRTAPGISGLAPLHGVPWIDLREGIAWEALGIDGDGLAAPLAHLGHFGDPTSARGGCEAIVEILSKDRWPKTVESPFEQLRRRLDGRRVEIIATGPTYSLRDQLKQRGYRWGGSSGVTACKSWKLSLPYSSARVELDWLRERLHPLGGVATMREIV